MSRFVLRRPPSHLAFRLHDHTPGQPRVESPPLRNLVTMHGYARSCKKALRKCPRFTAVQGFAARKAPPARDSKLVSWGFLTRHPPCPRKDPRKPRTSAIRAHFRGVHFANLAQPQNAPRIRMHASLPRRQRPTQHLAPPSRPHVPRAPHAPHSPPQRALPSSSRGSNSLIRSMRSCFLWMASLA